MQLFSADVTMLLFLFYSILYHKNLKKMASKVVHNQPKCVFFLSIANRPKSSPNLNSCPIKISTAGLLYNDFAWGRKRGHQTS